MKETKFGLPAYNEEKSIEKLFTSINENFPELKINMINNNLIYFKISDDYTGYALKKEIISHILENGINYSNLELDFKISLKIHDNSFTITEIFLNYNKRLDHSELNNTINGWKISKISGIYKFIHSNTFSDGYDIINNIPKGPEA